MSDDRTSKRSRRMGKLIFWTAAILLFKVFLAILYQYRWYFPPDFDQSAFLSGRKATFHGGYAAAFYVHVVSSPSALALATVLMFRRFHSLSRHHRFIGRVQLGLVLGLVVPSGWVIAQQAYAGPVAVLGFRSLAFMTGLAISLSAFHAVRSRWRAHRQWSTRSYLLLLSPLVLRLNSGLVIAAGMESESFYQLNAWISWLLPLAFYEIGRCALTDRDLFVFGRLKPYNSLPQPRGTRG